MAVVDRNVLRAGIWELLWGVDVPPKVGDQRGPRDRAALLDRGVHALHQRPPRPRSPGALPVGPAVPVAADALPVPPSAVGRRATGRGGGGGSPGRRRRRRRRGASGVPAAGVGPPGLGRARAGAGPGRDRPLARGARCLEGWVAGVAFFVPLLRWLTHTMTTFSTMPRRSRSSWSSPWPAYLALYWGAVTWALAWLRARFGPAHPVAGPRPLGDGGAGCAPTCSAGSRGGCSATSLSRACP